MAFARAAARAMMPRLVKYGWGSSQIIDWLGKYGATYRRATMLADIRQYSNMVDFGPKVVNYAKNKIIPKSLLGEVDFARARRYRVYATGKYTDQETGKVTYRRLSFYDDERRSKQAWADEFSRMKSEEEYMPSFAIEDIEVLYVEHNKGLQY